jgi:hypothetical protein
MAATLMLLLGALALPLVAGATRWCVAEPACLPGGGVEEPATGPGLQSALAAAEAHTNVGGADEVVIGPGTFNESGGFRYDGADEVVIRGAGEGATKLTKDAVAASSVMALEAKPGSAPSLSALTIVLPVVKDDTGLGMNEGRVENVAIESGAGSPTSTGLALNGGVFSHGSISVQEGTGAEPRGGEILYTSIHGAPNGVDATSKATLRGDRILASAPLVSFDTNPLIVEDTVLDMGGSTNIGAEIHAVSADTVAKLRHDLIVHGGHTALDVLAQSANAAVTIENSIFAETEASIGLFAEGGKTAAVFTNYSSYELGTVIESAKPGASVHFEHENMRSTLPSFVSPLTGDYHLAPGSPLIDAGTPGTTLAVEEFPTDVAGNPRIAHGRRDVGPYEYQWRGPVVSIASTPSSAALGSAINFSGSASAPEPGDGVTGYQWTFDDGTVVPAGATASHAFHTSGTHTATLTASDTLGMTGSATVQVKVAGEICAERACGGCSPALKCPLLADGLFGLSASPRSFHAAHHGSSFGKRQAGTKVSYTLRGGAAKVRFTVVRKAAGVASGKRCLALGSGRKGKRCTRLVKVQGSFAKQSKQGANSFRFTGRVGSASLSRGSYFLVASGKVAGRTFSVRASFSISG